ncbi:tRNA (N(6)-L-threonylcarbamoyladenosine(37)-C(2))-methylthiotransferase MtaB [Sphingomonas sp. LaA6.9]|uniref:tRNA (N(6)-L-threonylcarbamoyladenosine(37)-C(2))- methylthiotransferase MtaB n=1 Tax=Sphingomonas sp. LaA6.9 TaxID=2919914 RepID=UPI001F4FD3BA|nr:tRNA (N(6)-L-threonylcarbamoyladenosine(37)-C(2))-methylthiotransferase MtaB [Sphingomonas sp. LaA6.9]MCJ8157833.1 tRNA (N(6)-L-threonylcarbamoyladenosine(37)-C(2))-methylthiotransferase MtaB [Sphingomonas sp. LaA6.9]
MSGPELITLGCRLNIAESEAIRAIVSEGDDLVIVNSCAVTAEAVRQTRQAIRRAKRARPDARVIVTGCAAQIEPESFAAMPEVARVIGNVEKMQPESFLAAPDGEPAEVRVSDIMAVRQTAPQLASGFAEHARAFVEVQNGCDHRCTFCVIPYGRGNSRSVPAGAVVERIKALVDEGYREVVLTGVDLTSYGPDLPGGPSLGQLVERILRHVPALPRLRLSSLDSVEIDDRLSDLLAHEPRIMPHIHLSLQAGDDMILKRMKRRHSRAQSVAIVQKLKAARQDLVIGADIIAGFPTETEAMFENTLALIDDCDVVYGHVFPYSPRRGTPAALMPQLERSVIKDRARRLREAAALRQRRWLESLTGTKQKVLIELDGLSGHAENFARVRLAPRFRRNDTGKIMDIAITGLDGTTLTGVPA